MLHDRYLFDNSLERGGGEGWTVNRYLDDLQERYGGVDAVLLWHSYPNIGVDDRNQFDMLESLPGGTAGVRKMVADFHARGVKVMLPYNPWDQGTRNTGAPDYQTMVEATIAVGADGFNGDTMVGLNSSWMKVAATLGKPLNFEPECGLANLTDLAYDVSTWGYWLFGDRGQGQNTTLAPVASVYKFLENRHMVHISDRWGSGDGTPRTDGLHHAYFNGIGYETWENVWGIFNKISDRDAFVLKAGWSILREYGDLVSAVDTIWTPHATVLTAVTASRDTVFASQFEAGDKSQTLWLLVNRNTSFANLDADSKVSLRLPCKAGDQFFDLYAGQPLRAQCTNGALAVVLEVQPGGVGAVLRASGSSQLPRPGFMSKMSNLTRTSDGTAVNIGQLLSTSSLLPMTMEAESTPVLPKAPRGMVTIPGALSPKL